MTTFGWSEFNNNPDVSHCVMREDRHIEMAFQIA